MSSPSIGVTKVELSRWTMSWVIRSPSCSASRISRASPSVSGQLLEHLLEQPGGPERVLPGLVEEVEEDPVLGDERGQRHGARSYQSSRTSATRSAARAVPSPEVAVARGRRRPRAAPGSRRSGPGSSPSRVLVPGAHRDRALGVVAQREAGDAEVGRLLLDPAGVGQHGAARRPRARGSRGSRPGRSAGPRRRRCGAEHLARPRVDREDDRHLARRPRASASIAVAEQRPVDERRAVQRDEQVAAGLEAEPRAPPRAARKRSSSATRVSIIVLPTKCDRARPRRPRRAGSRAASSECRKSSSESWSVDARG